MAKLPPPPPALPPTHQPARPSRWLQTFRSLRHRNYRLWFFGQGLSLIGTWMQTVAQQVLLYRLTGSAAALGLASFIGLIPLAPLALWGGSMADRFPKRRVLLITQAAMLAQALALAVLTFSDAVQVWQVYVLTLALGAVQAIDIPVRLAFTSEMVDATGDQRASREDLTNAIGLNAAIFNAARAVGPALAGLTVAAVGESAAFFMNGLSFIPVLVSLLLMRGLPAAERSSLGAGGVAQHTAAGVRFVIQQRTLLILVSLVAVSALLAMPFNTLMPVFASETLNQSAQPVVEALCSRWLSCQTPAALPLGMLLSVVGVGALVGALSVASLPAQARRGRMLTIGNPVFPLILLAFALTDSFALALLLMFGAGVSFVWQNALANTLIQIHTPDRLRGRVLSLYSFTFQGMMRVGSLQAGFMADRLGAGLALGMGAAVALVYGLYVAVRYPAVRELA